MLRRILAVVVLALSLSVTASVARFPHGAPSGAVLFSTVQVGGAGAVTRVTRNATGSKLLAGADQYGCYLKTIGGGNWTQLVRHDTFPAGNASYDATYGIAASASCDDAVFDPSDTTKIWLQVNGGVYKSTDSGNSFSTTCFPQYATPSQSSGHDGITKAMGPYVAVDPFNSSVVYASTPNAGLSRSVNGGTSCATVTAVGTAGNVPNVNDCGGPCGGGHLIAFDPSTSTSSCAGGVAPCAKNIWVSTYGTGVYRSTDGGQTWNQLNTSGMPTSHMVMKADPFGRLWFVDNSNSNGVGVPWLWAANTWTTKTAVTQSAVGIDFDPNNCSAQGSCHMTIVSGGGNSATGMASSTDGGSTWSISMGNYTVAAGDVPWISTLQNGAFSLYTANAAYDNTGEVWTGTEGVEHATPISSNSVLVTWTPQIAGIEESLSSSMATSSATSGSLIIGTWDVNCFRVVQPFNTFPGTSNRGCYSTNGFELQHTYILDWATATPAFMVALTDNQNRGGYNNYSGKSTDGGINWTALSTPTEISTKKYIGGCIAASSTTNYMMAGTDGSGGYVPPYYTTDGGTTWTPISITGTVETPLTNAITSAGSDTLHFASTTGVVDGDTVTNTSAATTIQAGTTVASHTSTTVTLSLPATTTGVANGNTINFAHLGGGSTNINTNALTPSGDLLFASVPAGVAVGMNLYDDTAASSINQGTTVMAKTSTTVVLSKAPVGTVASGDKIVFSAGGWPFQIYGAIKVCAADRVTANTFYWYNWNDGITGDAIVKCTSSGASCSIQSRPGNSPNQGFTTILKSVPGNAGHIFLSWQGNDPTDNASGGLKYYTDGGVTPNTVAGFKNVHSFGFGAPFAGHTYPAIVVLGLYNGVYGIWQSSDWDGAKTWQQVGTTAYPKNLLFDIKDIDGDKVIPNVFYYTGSSGTYCSSPSTAYCNGT